MFSVQTDPECLYHGLCYIIFLKKNTHNVADKYLHNLLSCSTLFIKGKPINNWNCNKIEKSKGNHDATVQGDVVKENIV